MELLVALLVLLGVGYVVSVFLHPYVACEACKGQGRHRGSVFTYAHRPCHKCSGSGRKQRLGARWLGRGEARQGSSRMP